MAANLATLQDFKDWADITGYQDDKMLSRLVSAASGFIYNYLNRDALLIATYTETYRGPGTATLVTKYFPIVSVASLKLNGVVINESLDKLQPGFFINKEGTAVQLAQQFYTAGPLLAPTAAPFKFYYAQVVEITYDAGYATIPDPIVQACIEVAYKMYLDRKRQFKRSESMAGQTVSYETNALTDQQKQALANYRRLIPV